MQQNNNKSSFPNILFYYGIFYAAKIQTKFNPINPKTHEWRIIFGGQFIENCSTK